MSSKKQAGRHRVSVMTQHGGRTDTSVDVYVTEAGDLIMDGYDVGAGPQEFYDDSDYEYGVTVKQEHLERLLVLLIQHLFSETPTPTSDFMTWLKERDIPYEFEDW